MENIEKIIEQRTIEATVKNLTGRSGKICTVVRTLGEKINEQVQDDNTFIIHLPEGASEKDKNDIYFYDCLSQGLNLQIVYDEYQREVKVTFGGRVVYWEQEGEILGYNPIDIWENKIEALYAGAIKTLKHNQTIDNINQSKKQSNNLLKLKDAIKKIWGAT